MLSTCRSWIPRLRAPRRTTRTCFTSASARARNLCRDWRTPRSRAMKRGTSVGWGRIWSAPTLWRTCSDCKRILLLGAGDEDHLVRWLAVLRSCGAAEAYARYYSLRVEPARVIEFLLLNSVFPQAVCFSLRTARSSLQVLAADVLDGPTGASRQGVSPAVRGLGLLTAQLENVGVDEVLEGGLQPYLTDVQRQIAGVCDHITRVYLRDEPQPGRLVAVARAAMLMAAQQQQQQ